MATRQRIIINIRDASGERDATDARRTIAWWLFGLALLLMLFCGLFPFDFSISFSGGLSEIREKFDLMLNDLWISESAKKLLLYVPFGFALGSILWVRLLPPGRRKAQQIVLRCAIGFACGAALATAVEILQVFLSRDPSLADIVSKSTGSAIGFVGFIAAGEPVVRWLSRQLVAVRKLSDPRIFGTAAAAWLLIAIIAPICARNIGSLSSWEPAYPMIIGNETDGVRHWDGTVSNVWMSAAAVDDNELETILTSSDPSKLLGDSLVTSFHLTGAGPYVDATRNTEALGWTPNFKTGAVPGTTQPADLTGVAAVGRPGVPISEGWWLATANGGAAKISGRIARTDAFLLVMDFANQDLDHGFGWPHIFSISGNAEECNLQLLQDHENLQLRIRSAATGDGGTDPEFYVPGIFIDTLPQRLAVSYDHGRITVESSKSGERYSLAFLPDAWLIWRIFPSSYWHFTMDSPGQPAARAMYRIAAMLPLGMLLGAMLRVLRRRRGAKQIQRIFIGSVCGAALLLEASLHWGAGTPVGWWLPIVSVLGACGGTMLVLGYLPVRQRGV